jgi:hypothetical protein
MWRPELERVTGACRVIGMDLGAGDDQCVFRAAEPDAPAVHTVEVCVKQGDAPRPAVVLRRCAVRD